MSKSQPLPLEIDDFDAFYRAVNSEEDKPDRSPFEWQRRLVRQVCRTGWPDYIKLPTASGKTTTIEIAVFSLAFQAAIANRKDGRLTAPRRIFFVVDRRIIVNEAFIRARLIANRLRDSLVPSKLQTGKPEQRQILGQVAWWLRQLTGDDSAPPLDCFELRGGIYRNDSWVRSLLQPTILTSTVDQVGSRLLFRGYGVSDRNLSIHAALTANDSLIILDEAHCSKPFSQTLDAVIRYRSKKWASQVVESPFHYVQMTATPPADLGESKVFSLESTDYEIDSALKLRHDCSKPVELVIAKNAKNAKPATVAKQLVKEAMRLATAHGLQKVAIVANRVAIAREAYNALCKEYAEDVDLMIGRMRPVDRDDLTKKLQDRFRSGSERSTEETKPKLVVATQCLEVGADFDFDGMVTQCASLDALRQRFGRLNRLGETTDARGVVVIADGDIVPIEKIADSKPDAIYGNAIAHTWAWLNHVATKSSVESLAATEVNPVVDFGILKLESLIAKVEKLDELLAPAEDAPVLMPAHVDMLCQTSPRPALEPDVSAYLHGPDRGCPEVKICWRADLDLSGVSSDATDRDWIATVELCPPSAAECLSVPLYIFRKWLSGEKLVDDASDVLGEQAPEPDESVGKKATTGKPGNAKGKVLVWKGKMRTQRNKGGSFCVRGDDAGTITANSTIVIPVEYGGWNALGHLPHAPEEPTSEPRITCQLMMGKSADDKAIETARKLAIVDVAERAFLQSRARTVFRVNPKLTAEADVAPLAHELQTKATQPEANTSLSYWRDYAETVRDGLEAERKITFDADTAPLIVRLTKWRGNKVKGKIVKYPRDVGVVWITERHQNLTDSILPLPSFGGDDEDLNNTGKLNLRQHLADVNHETSRTIDGLSIDAKLAATIQLAAQFHDLGKADPRFQAMLIDKPVSMAYMQPKLWAKSDPSVEYSRDSLPFRHEMVSLALIDYLEFPSEDIDDSLLRHSIAAHHGYARPFAPLRHDEEHSAINLKPLGGPVIASTERKKWIPAHRLDSGISDRFWGMNRRCGWWGLALLETILRLADWKASASPNRCNASLELSPRQLERDQENGLTASSLVLDGIDGCNPLAFLSALGLFRIASHCVPDAKFQMHWAKQTGAWRPVLTSRCVDLNQKYLLDLLERELTVLPEDHPAIRLSGDVDSNGLRHVLIGASQSASADDRSDADWLSCNYSDIATKSDAISQLQTTRRDYHSINVLGLVRTTAREHLERSLFAAWDYADPIAGVSLHLEPREDRRHAYQWHMPSGDPTRSSSGGMIGANRLALEAWPVFQSLPAGEKLTTVGFLGSRANDTSFTWPIWNVPISYESLRSLLSLKPLLTRKLGSGETSDLGIAIVYRSSRILVGKTPNLTSSIPVPVG